MHKIMVLTMGKRVEVAEFYYFEDSTPMHDLSNKFDEIVQRARRRYDCAISAVWRHFTDNGQEWIRNLDIPAKK